MKKICKICGKSRCMFPWEDICYTCRPKKDLTEIQQRIKDNVTANQTSGQKNKPRSTSAQILYLVHHNELL